jgi:hypothetical protein
LSFRVQRKIGPFLKCNKKSFFFSSNYWSTHYEIFSRYVINLLLELIFDLGKKTWTFTFMLFLVRPLPEVQNQFGKQIGLKIIPNYINICFPERFDQ